MEFKKYSLRLIIINTILWPLIYAHIFVFDELRSGQCLPGNDVHSIFLSIYAAILPLSLTLIFGLFTFKNLHKIKRLINPILLNDTPQSNRRIRLTKKEIQLCKIIINQALLFIILNIMNPCYLLYQAFTMHMTKSPLRQLIELSFYNTTYVFILLESALTFFIYILSSSVFRREFIRLIRTKFLRHRA